MIWSQAPASVFLSTCVSQGIVDAGFLPRFADDPDKIDQRAGPKEFLGKRWGAERRRSTTKSPLKAVDVDEVKMRRNDAMHRFDIVVVGAGLSGLAAARRLIESGAATVVLEARDRVGGRTLTTDLAGHAVDLGGQFIGPGQDRLRDLARTRHPDDARPLHRSQGSFARRPPAHLPRAYPESRAARAARDGVDDPSL